MISNCGHDENNRYSGGKAGDQTGTEWRVINWYNRPWKCVLRHPDLTVLPEKEWLSTNTMQEGTRLFGTLPFLLYTVLQVALFVFRISLFHSDRLSGHRLHIFHRVPAFLPVSLRFSDVSGHNPVVVLNSVFYLDIPLS